MNKEMLFMVCDVPKTLERMLRDIRNQSCENMTKENLDGYDCAVMAALDIIKQIIHTAEMDGEILVHSNKISDGHDLEELDLQELLELFGRRVASQL